MFTRKNLVLPLALFAMASSAFAEPTIYNFYPSCEYTVLETVTVSKEVVSKNGTIASDQQYKTTDEILDEIRALGAEKEAFGILLVGRELNRKAPAKTGRRSIGDTITMEAELISGCEGEFTLSENSTPYTLRGEKRIDLALFKGYAQKVLIERKQEMRQEGVSDDVAVLPQQVFGVPLGAAAKDVENALGYPSVVFDLDEQTRVLGYGRDMWVLMDDDTLAGVTTENMWFSQEFINMIPYRPKYDEMSWSLLNLVSKGEFYKVGTFSGEKRKGLKVALNHSGADFTVLLDEDDKNTVSGFTLLKPTINKTRFSNRLDLSTPDLNIDWVSIMADSSAFDLDSLGAPKAKILSESKEDIYVYSPHFYATVKFNKASQISATENLFNNSAYNQERWKFDQYYSGQDWLEVVKTLPEDRIEMVGKILISDANVSRKFFFYEENNSEKLYQLHYVLH